MNSSLVPTFIFSHSLCSISQNSYLRVERMASYRIIAHYNLKCNLFLCFRISVIFRVRSAKAVKITDAGNLTSSFFVNFEFEVQLSDATEQSWRRQFFVTFSCIYLFIFPALLKRLGVLCGCISVALLIRTIVAPPVVVVGRTADDLKAFLCKTNWWDHTFTSSKFFFSLFFTSFTLSHKFSPYILLEPHLLLAKNPVKSSCNFLEKTGYVLRESNRMHEFSRSIRKHLILKDDCRARVERFEIFLTII